MFIKDIFIFEGMIIGNNVRPLIHAPNGLKLIRAQLNRNPDIPNIAKVSAELQAIFTAAKQITIDQKITSKYNIVKLIRWIIEEIKEELNSSVLMLEPSELNIAFTMLKMMEMNQLIKALFSKQVVELGKHASDIFQNMLEDSSRHCQEFSKKIKDENCRLISQNCRKSKDVLLLKLNQIINNHKILISSFLQLELNCVFANIMLNLRRLIRQVKASRQNECKPYYRSLKALQLKLYYLSIAPIPKTQGYVRRISDDIFNLDRKTTYIYLIHDEKGIYQLYKYFHEAPIKQLEEDMKLMSQTYQRQMQKNDSL